MKKNMMALLFTMGAISDAFAVRILTSEQVTLEVGGVEQVRAYRDMNACRSWYWMPVQYKSYGNYWHMVDGIAVEVPTSGNASSVGLGLVSSFEFDVKPTNNSANGLKEKIAKYVNAKLQEAEVPTEYQGCLKSGQTSIAPADIVLNVIPVRSTQGTLDAEAENARVKTKNYAKISIINGEDGAYTSPLSEFALAYKHDATNPHALRIANKWKGLDAGKVLGSIVFDIDGAQKRIDSKLRIKGKLSAEFESQVKKTSCTTSSTTDDNAVLGAAIGVLAGGGVVGALVGGSLFGDSETSTTVCNFQLMTEMKKGFAGMKVTIEHSADLEGKFRQVCDDGECQTVSLQQWAEAKLLEHFLSANFDLVLNRIQDETFETRVSPKGLFNGRQGSSNSEIDLTIHLKENDFIDTKVGAKVIKGESMGGTFYPTDFSSTLMNCVQKSYNKQLYINRVIAGKNFIPADQACFN